MSLEDKLRLIQEAVQEAGGDKKKEAAIFNNIVDPQDANSCEGCQ